MQTPRSMWHGGQSYILHRTSSSRWTRRRDGVAHHILVRLRPRSAAVIHCRHDCWRNGTVGLHLLTVQRVAAAELCAAGVQVRLHYATTREGQTQRHGRAKNYRPISNLTVISKLLERVTLACCRRAVRLSKISFDGDRFGKNAVGHTDFTRPWRRTVAPLALFFLDISAAFDTVDYCALLCALSLWLVICGAALDWILS